MVTVLRLIIYLLEITCKIHIRETEEKILNFNDDTAKKCRSVLKIRKQANLKYSSLNFPEYFDKDDGYHLQCYRTFTALPKSQREKLKVLLEEDIIEGVTDTECPQIHVQNENMEYVLPKKRVTRGKTSSKSKSKSTGVFIKSCLFCCSVLKRLKSRKLEKLVSCTTKKFEIAVINMAENLQDESLLRKIRDIDFVAKEVKYHPSCRVKYYNRYKTVVAKRYKQFKQPSFKSMYEQCFKDLTAHLEQILFQQNEVWYLNDVVHLFKSLLYEANSSLPNDKQFDSRIKVYLKHSLTDNFGRRIKMIKSPRNKKIYMYSTSIHDRDAYIKLISSKSRYNTQMQDVALHLRKTILSLKKRKFGENITLNDISQGEVSVPEDLEYFIKFVLFGIKDNTARSKIKDVRSHSISSDIVFAATNGLKRPKKQLQYGLTIKSLCNSKKLINIANHYGHCADYDTICVLENQITSSLADKD